MADLRLLRAIQNTPGLGPDSFGARWLVVQVNLEMSRIAGITIPGDRKPVQWGSAILALVIACPLGLWTYLLDKSEFRAWSLLPGIVAALFLYAAFALILSPGRNEVVTPEAQTAATTEPGAALGRDHQ
jgi:hypothetical protein